MPVRVDPEGNETHALFNLANFSGQRVLEVGCGDGRLTRRYAHLAAQVTAIEPFRGSLERAARDLAPAMQGRVEFHNLSIEGFAVGAGPSLFDLAVLSWSL